MAVADALAAVRVHRVVASDLSRARDTAGEIAARHGLAVETDRALREIDLGERVWFDRDKVRAVLERVRRQLSPETEWGFNYEDDREWVLAESSVDLEALVEEALAAG